MQSRSRLVAASVLVALAVAACGGSATPAGSSGPAASVAPTALGSPDASAATVAPPDASAAGASAAASSAAPAGSAAPRATPSPAEQALMDLLPMKLGPLGLSHTWMTGKALIDGAPQANKGLGDFLTTIGLKPADLLVAFALPTSVTNIPMSVIAYRFVGADPATLKTKFIKANQDSQPGMTVKDEQVGGRAVTALLAPAGDSGPPVYLLFNGDTVFVASSSDAATAAQIVQSFPK